MASLILSDPPLLPRDIPAPLQASTQASGDPLEQRLVADSFFHFQHDGPYLEHRATLAEGLPLHLLVEMQSAFRRADGFSD